MQRSTFSPLHRDESQYATSWKWKIEGFSIKRERLYVQTVDNKQVRVQIVSQGLFARAVSSITKFFGFNTRDYGKTVSEKRYENLNSSQIEALITSLKDKPASSAVDTWEEINKALENINTTQTELVSLQDAALPQEVREKAKKASKELSESAKSLSNDLPLSLSAKVSSPSADKFPENPKVTSLFESIDPVITPPPSKLDEPEKTPLEAGLENVEESEEPPVDIFASDEPLPVKSSPQVPLPEFADPMQAVQMANLQKTMQAVQSKSQYVLQKLSEEESLARKDLKDYQKLESEIQRIRSLASDVLQLSNPLANSVWQANDPALSVEQKLANAKALCEEIDLWIEDVKNIHSTILAEAHIGRKITDVLEKLQDFPISTQEIWLPQFEALHKTIANEVGTPAQAAEKEKELHSLINELSQSLIAAAPLQLEAFQAAHTALEKVPFDTSLKSSVIQTRQQRTDVLEKSMPTAKATLTELHAWQSVLNKEISIDKALSTLLTASPPANLSDLIKEAVAEAGRVGNAILAHSKIDELEDFYEDDIEATDAANNFETVQSIQLALDEMSGNQGIALEDLHAWTDKLLTLTYKALKELNFPSQEKEQELRLQCNQLSALKDSIDILIEANNNSHEGHFATLEAKRDSLLESCKHNSMNVYFDAVIQKLKTAATWKNDRPLGELPQLQEEWAAEAKNMNILLPSFEKIADRHQAHNKVLEDAYKIAEEAPDPIQVAIERTHLEKEMGKISDPDDVKDLLSAHQLVAYIDHISSSTVKLKKFCKTLQLTNAQRKDAKSQCERYTQKIAKYRAQITEIEKGLDVSLKDLFETDLTEIESYLAPFNENSIKPTSAPTRKWWNLLSPTVVKSQAKIDTEEPTRSDLLASDSRKAVAISKVKNALKGNLPSSAFYRAFKSFEDSKNKIQEVIEALKEQGQIVRAHQVITQLSSRVDYLKKWVQEYRSRLDLQPSNSLYTTASDVTWFNRKWLIEQLESYLPVAAKDLGAIYGKAVELESSPALPLLDQINKATTPELKTALKNALIKELHDQMTAAKSKWVTEIKNLDTLKLPELSANLKETVQKYSDACDALKLNVTLKRGYFWQKGVQETVAVEKLTIQDMRAYHTAVKQAIDQGNHFVNGANQELKAFIDPSSVRLVPDLVWKNKIIDPADLENAIKKAHQQAEQLDKSDQLIALHKLKEMIEQAETFQKDAFDSIKTLPQLIAYRKNFIKILNKLKKAIDKANRHSVVSIPDQLSQRNFLWGKIPPDVDKELRTRFFGKVLVREIDECKKKLQTYKTEADGKLEPYIKKYADWEVAPPELQQANPGIEWLQPVESVPLNTLIKSKINQIEELKRFFVQKGWIYNSKVFVGEDMPVKDLKHYYDVLKTTSKELVASIEKETHIARTSREFTSLQTQLQHAKDRLPVLEEKRQILRKNSLNKLIEDIENDLIKRENSISSKQEMESFSSSLKTFTTKLQHVLTADAAMRDQTMLEQLQIAPANSLAYTSLHQFYIADARKLIADYEGKLTKLENAAAQLAEKKIITYDMCEQVQKMISADKFGTVAPLKTKFTITETSESKTFFIKKNTTTITKTVLLEDLSLTELEAYDRQLKAHVLEGNFKAPNPYYGIANIDRQLSIKSLDEFVNGDVGFGIAKTLEHLEKRAEKAAKNYDDDQKEEFQEKISALVDTTRLIVDSTLINLESKISLSIAVDCCKAQLKHLEDTIERLEKQIKKNKQAKKSIKTPPTIKIPLPATAEMEYQIRLDPHNYQTNEKYLAARLEFLTGIKIPKPTVALLTPHLASVVGGPQPLHQAPTGASAPQPGSPHKNASQMMRHLIQLRAAVWNLSQQPNLNVHDKSALEKAALAIEVDKIIFQNYHLGIISKLNAQKQPSFAKSITDITTPKDLIEYLQLMQKGYLEITETVKKEFERLGYKPPAVLGDMQKGISWNY